MNVSVRLRRLEWMSKMESCPLFGSTRSINLELKSWMKREVTVRAPLKSIYLYFAAPNTAGPDF